MDVRVIHNGAWTYPGGGERVARALAEAFDAPITVGHTSDPEFWQGLDVEFAFQDSLRRGMAGMVNSKVQTLGDFRLSQKFKSLTFEEDILISTGTSAKWFVPEHDQLHIHYCHFPPESLYKQPTSGIVDWSLLTPLSVLDRHFAAFVDVMVANSEFTRDHVEKYYGFDDVEVLNPPVDTSRYFYAEPSPDTYFVTIGRLDEKKRATTIARAFSSLDANLVMIGDGPKRKTCEKYGATVYPNLSDFGVALAVARSAGGIALAEEEHFGIVPKEYQAAGKPAIVPDEPNLNNHVTNGVDGVVVEPTVEGVKRGVRRALETRWDTFEIQQTAEDVSVDRFKVRALDLVNSIVSEDNREHLEKETIA